MHMKEPLMQLSKYSITKSSLDCISIDKSVAGVDEAGRGPLAGPVIAAAVILDPDNPVEGLKDSKKLSEKKREQLNIIIRKKAIAYATGYATVDEIDEMNILQASMLAMRRAVEQLPVSPDHVLVDGNQAPQIAYPVTPIIKGDDKENCIAAASIIAKVMRDQEMRYIHEEFSDYGFNKHKGYPTKLHIQAIKKYGVTRHHRRSFRPVREML